MKRLVYGFHQWVRPVGWCETSDSDNPRTVLCFPMTLLSRVAMFVVPLVGAFAVAAPVDGNAAIGEAALTGTLAGAMVAFVLPWAYASGDVDRTPPATEE